MARGNDAEKAEELIKVADQLEPFVPRARSVCEKMMTAANAATKITPKMKDTAQKMKDGTADLKFKEGIAEDIKNFGTDSKNVLDEMDKIATGG
ncbi:hypothetical protein RHP02_25760, partial [Salmonella enterica subsp. enterica serovar Typhimurium]|nr:hypothetical protein [Salmonella enterica subsp. enterica serovar Typhimurium]